MTYEESALLMQDATFRGRIKVAVLKYSSFIQVEPPETMAHNSRYRWAMTAAQQPDMTAQQIQPMVVMDPQVQLEGATVEDLELQTAVEAVVNKII